MNQRNGVRTLKMTNGVQPQSDAVLAKDRKGSVENSAKEVDKSSSVVKKDRVVELTFLLSVSSVVILAYGVVFLHWILPYFFTITAPPLLLYRLVTYWKQKWQLFMLDFCYFGNLLCFIYLWALPSQSEVFTVLFAFCTGPLPWATILFRNSLVFHDIGHLTSVFIHVLPCFLGFNLRWYSKSMSSYWYTDFVDTYNEDIEYMFLWLIGLPYSLFLLHTFLYTVFVNYLCVPGEEYLDTLRYFSSSDTGTASKLLRFMGPNHKLFMFNLVAAIYGLLSLSLVPLFYKYYLTHCVFVVLVSVITIWNGAGYYARLLHKKGGLEDIE